MMNCIFKSFGLHEKTHKTFILAFLPHLTGPNYHPLWRQMSVQWVDDHGDPKTLATCLETSWNTPPSSTAGYCEVGRCLGRVVAAYWQGREAMQKG